MEWGALIGPAVVAAVVAGIISIRTSSAKLAADRELAKQKAADDIALAKQKFDYDRAQAVFKRRFELAEHILSDAYQFRSLMKYVRNGFSMSGEGESRTPEDNESAAIKRSRDTYFVPFERLRKQEEFLAAMFARRTSSQAHFGPEAERAFVLLQKALHRTRVASSLLVEWTKEYGAPDRATMEKLRQDIWEEVAKHAGKDEIGADIEEGVEILERLCRPVLEWAA